LFSFAKLGSDCGVHIQLKCPIKRQRKCDESHIFIQYAPTEWSFPKHAEELPRTCCCLKSYGHNVMRTVDTILYFEIVNLKINLIEIKKNVHNIAST
jgi:hypothetical protein